MTEENTNTITIKKGQIWKYSALVFGLLFIGTFFFQGGSSTGNVIEGGGEPGGIVEVKTTIQGFQYDPDVITVKEGSRVRLTIENKDNVVHGLHLPQFGIVDSQPPLNTKTFEFVAIVTSTNGQAVPTCSLEHGETLTFNVV